MKQAFLAVVAILFLTANSYAEESASQISTTLPKTSYKANKYANVNQGDFAISSTLGSAYNRITGSMLNLDAAVQYFVLNDFSVGGTVDYSLNENYSTVGVGPGFTYYFWSKDKLTTFIGADGIYHRTNVPGSSYGPSSYSYWSGRAKLGLNYHITPEVAFGPSFNFLRDFDASVDSANSFMLVGNFSIYL
jgi:hypothetical protein